MKLWEYVIHADKIFDLTRPEKVQAWWRELSWGPLGDWPVANNWRSNVLALRSLAARLKRRKLPRSRRPVSMKERVSEVDAIGRGYVGKMKRSLIYEQSSPQLPLSASNFKGVWNLPTYKLPEPMKLDAEGTKTIDRMAVDPFSDPGWWGSMLARATGNPASLWANDADVFWQLVFDSLFDENSFVPVFCGSCGDSLGTFTDGGRQKRRRETCKACQQRAWFKKQPVATRRAKWRKDDHKKQERKKGSKR